MLQRLAAALAVAILAPVLALPTTAAQAAEPGYVATAGAARYTAPTATVKQRLAVENRTEGTRTAVVTVALSRAGRTYYTRTMTGTFTRFVVSGLGKVDDGVAVTVKTDQTTLFYSMPLAPASRLSTAGAAQSAGVESGAASTYIAQGVSWKSRKMAASVGGFVRPVVLSAGGQQTVVTFYGRRVGSRVEIAEVYASTPGRFNRRVEVLRYKGQFVNAVVGSNKVVKVSDAFPSSDVLSYFTVRATTDLPGPYNPKSSKVIQFN